MLFQYYQHLNLQFIILTLFIQSCMNLTFVNHYSSQTNLNKNKRFGSIEMPKPSLIANQPYTPKYLQPLSKPNSPKTKSCSNQKPFPPLPFKQQLCNNKNLNLSTKRYFGKSGQQNQESQKMIRGISPDQAHRILINTPFFKTPLKHQGKQIKLGNQLQAEPKVFQPRLSYNIKLKSPPKLNFERNSKPTSDSNSSFLSEQKPTLLRESFDCKSMGSSRIQRTSLMVSKEKQKQKGHSLLKQQKGHSLLKQQKGLQIVKVPAFIREKESAKSRKSSGQIANQQNAHKPLSYAQISQCFNQLAETGFEIQINIKPALKKRKLEDFELLKQLGEGSFGKAFLALQKTINFICVLKVLDKEKLTPVQIDNLIRETKIQYFMNHPHLTGLYGFFDDQSSIYLILELLPSGDLRSKMKNRGMPQANVAAIIKPICLGINHMHKFDLIHRDIKPENIFTFENYIKLGDFGCAVYCPDRRQSFVGSPCYLSPEQLRSEEYDNKVDIWEIGTLAYQLLFKVCPFQKDILAMIQGSNSTKKLSDLKFPPQIPVSQCASDFLKKCLNKDPQERMSLQQALQHSFLKSLPKEVWLGE